MTSNRVLQAGAIEGVQTVKNYITNGTFELGNAAGWAAYLNTAQALPVSGTGGSPTVTFAAQSGGNTRGIYSGRLTKSAANSQGQGISFDFTVDAQDAGRPLSITCETSASANYVAGDVTCYVYDVTNSTVITPASITIAAGRFSFNAFFVSTASSSYRLIFHVATTNASAFTLDLDSIFVGPQVFRVGGAETDWQAYTPTVVNGGSKGWSSSAGRYRRVGDSLEVEATLISDAVAAGAGASNFAMSLPAGLLIDTTKLSVGLNNPIQINGTAQFINASGIIQSLDGMVPVTTSAIGFSKPGATGLYTTVDFNSAAAFYISAKFTLPIVQWSSNITMADRVLEEFASNSSATDAADTTSFVYGSAGSAGVVGVTALTAIRKKRVRFTTPIQPTDKVALEFDLNATGDWTAVGESVSIGQDYIPQYNQQNTVTFGAGWCAVSGSKTDIDVVFAQYSFPVGATYGAVGLGWSYAGFNAAKWRVRKVSSGAQIGGAIVSSNIVGRVDGNAPAAGYIGESLTNKVAAFTGSGGRVQIATLTLTPGVWLMSAVFTNSIINVAVGGTSLGICISTTSGNSTAGCVDGYDLVEGGFNAASGYGGVCIPSKVVVVPPGASVPYYLNGRTDHTTANDMVCSLSAVRIA